MIGQTVSHYKILVKLGEGGMGIVYKAQDTKLDREVALKFLPHHIASSDVDRARFLQEAKAAAVLNHPNICTIHGIEEHDGQQFIEMEYVDGVTLRNKFSESPLKINDAIGYAIQIGEALQEAHSKGIVHRDVKSENIMINSKNQVKVMDFGLAKLRGSVKLTKSSSTTGTLAYMAPEQIQGQEIDARADIFSFGGMSPDGKWITFPAGDADRRWDMYFMSTLGGEPRRITSDSALFVNLADILPDGSQIVYDRTYNTSSLSICVVPSLGGISKVVVKDDFSPRWRPDGERIGYINFPNNFQFWSVRADGSDNRMEFADTISLHGRSRRFSFAWSPDGHSVAWLTTFPESYQEIFIWDLTSAQSRQLTFDKKKIDEVFWMRNDEIIFSSNKSGNSNLWVIPSKGGQAVQLTKGSGPDLGIRGSWDNKKLIYIQQQDIGNLWLTGLDGSGARQLTFGDQNINNPDISPDGRHIVFQVSESDPLKALGQSIYMINRDGSGQRSLTSEDMTSMYPRWSPDGKWISYQARKPSEPNDSSNVFLIEAANPGMPKNIGRGSHANWISDSSLIFWKFPNSWLHVDGSPPQQYFEDSTFAFPVDKFILFFDNHAGKQGFFRVKKGDASDKAVKISENINSAVHDVAGKKVYMINSSNELVRLDVVTLKVEKIKGVPLGSYSSSIRPDEKEMVYSDRQTRSKLVIIENLFK